MTMLKTMMIIAVALLIVSCNSGEKHKVADKDVSGIYVREYAVEISNPNTGEKIGMQQVRDSIFIKAGGDGYEVSNRKWRMNDYDQEGWVSMAHDDDRPTPTFLASFDEASERLSPKSSDLAQPIYVDAENRKLFRNSSKDIVYEKVN